ncbi:hypothetical protein ACFX19_043817 [Malus domestica]
MELSPPAFTKLATTHVALPFGSPSLHPPTTDKIAPLSGRPISTIQSTVNVPSSPSSKLGISTDAGKSTVWATTTTSLSPAHLTLHSSGNRVLLNSNNHIVLWQNLIPQLTPFSTPTLHQTCNACIRKKPQQLLHAFL